MRLESRFCSRFERLIIIWQVSERMPIHFYSFGRLGTMVGYGERISLPIQTRASACEGNLSTSLHKMGTKGLCISFGENILRLILFKSSIFLELLNDF